LAVAAFFRLNIGEWFTEEEVRAWELPEYFEMLKLQD
jgi:hypothetical protein